MAEDGDGMTTEEVIGNLTFSQNQQYDMVTEALGMEFHGIYFDRDKALILEIADDHWRFTITIDDNPLDSFWFLLARQDDLIIDARLSSKFKNYVPTIKGLMDVL